MNTTKTGTTLGAALLMLIGSIGCSAAIEEKQLGTDGSTRVQSDSSVRFGKIVTGRNSCYHQQEGKHRQDLSGAATDGHQIIFVDDGGDPSEFNYVRIMTALPDNSAVNTELKLVHKDLEGATYHRGFFVVTGSLSETNGAETDRLTRFKIDGQSNELIEQASVSLRDGLMAALRDRFGQEWYDRIKGAEAKKGGLNVEGLSRPDRDDDRLLLGLRSPLFGNAFPEKLNDGEAIIAVVDRPFEANRSFEFKTVDLQGAGIRGIEWIPDLDAYVIISGPVEKGKTYGLWLLQPTGILQKISLQGFDELCRPEAVIQLNKDEKASLIVLSEASDPCDCERFNYIQAEILSDRDGRD